MPTVQILSNRWVGLLSSIGMMFKNGDSNLPSDYYFGSQVHGVVFL